MLALLLVLVLIAGWQALARFGNIDPLILPAPTDVAQSLWDDRGLLAPDLWTTTWEVLLGLAASIAAASSSPSPCTSRRWPAAPCARWSSAPRPCRSR